MSEEQPRPEDPGAGPKAGRAEIIVTEHCLPDLGSTAVHLATSGTRVFPLVPGGKTPLIKGGGGFRGATTDEATIRGWWAKWPTANIGIACGASGIFVVDLDVRDGKPGVPNWTALVGGRAVPDTYTVRSPSGGVHLYFRAPDTALPSTRGELAAGIDTRGFDGYTVGPGSVLDGDDDAYHVECDAQIAETPAWLVAAMLEVVNARRSKTSVRSEVGDDGEGIVPANDVLDRVQQWAQELARAPEGKGNQTANRTAFMVGQYVGAGQIERSDAEESMQAALNGWTWRRGASDERAMRHQISKSIGDGMRTPRMWDANPPTPALHTLDASKEPAPTPPVSGRRRLVTTTAAQIRPERLNWLWDRLLPVGMLGLLAGREGLGKSSVAFWVIGRVTRGELPGAYLGEPRPVLVSATEDSWAHVIVPRLMACGANLSLVHRIEVAEDEDDTMPLTLPTDVGEVGRFATEVGAVLMVLDPVISRLADRLDSDRDKDVRRALEPMARMADQAGMTVWGLIHHNKSGNRDPMQVIMGSRAFGAVVRSVCTVMRDPDDETGRRCLFGLAKSNLGPMDLPVQAFTIEGTIIEGGAAGMLNTSRVEWLGEVTGTIREAMDREADFGQDSTAIGAATRWLMDYLAERGGEADTRDIKRAGHAVGHQWHTLQRARVRIGAETSKTRTAYPDTIWRLVSAEAGQNTTARRDVVPALPVLPADHAPLMAATRRTGTTGMTSPGADVPPVPAGATGPCVRCQRRHPHRYGPGGTPLCPDCRTPTTPRRTDGTRHIQPPPTVGRTVVSQRAHRKPDHRQGQADPRGHRHRQQPIWHHRPRCGPGGPGRRGDLPRRALVQRAGGEPAQGPRRGTTPGDHLRTTHELGRPHLRRPGDHRTGRLGRRRAVDPRQRRSVPGSAMIF